MRRIRTLVVTTLVALSMTGCAAFKLEPPAGFAEVYDDEDGSRMKSGDNVGLRVNVFGNVKGGTLEFWSIDLVKKLGMRGYQLVRHTPAKSKNGIEGTRFDFRYTPVSDNTQEHFYTAVLFATDKNRVVIQLAGLAEHYDRYAGRIDEIAKDTKVRGCKIGSKICKGGQPTGLSTPAAASQGQKTPPEADENTSPNKAEAAKAE